MAKIDPCDRFKNLEILKLRLIAMANIDKKIVEESTEKSGNAGNARDARKSMAIELQFLHSLMGKGSELLH